MLNSSSEGKVSVILLTYNSISKLKKGFFDRVLRSVIEQDYSNLELVIVDNDSRDGTVHYARENYAKYFSNIRILELRRNYGWGGGNNRGALLCRGSDFLLFMNDDVILERSCINKLVSVLCKQKRIAAVQPLIRKRDSSLNCGFDLAMSGFPGTIAKPRKRPVSKAFFTSGAALLTRADCFFEIEMFDENLFLYHDDLDYCWRLRLAGYEAACLTDAKAYHYGGATLGYGTRFLYFFIRNNIWVLAKNSALRWLPLRIFFAVVESLIIFLTYACALKPHVRKVKKAIAVLRGLLDGFRGLRIAFNERARVQKMRRVSEQELNKAMNVFVDIEYIFPKPLRELRKLRW